MKIPSFLCALFILPLSVFAVDVTVGYTQLSIPTPEGFSLLTSEMKPYAEISKRFVAETNEQLALFLPNDDIALAAKGGTPDVQRKFDVQVVKQLIKPFITKSDFADIKKMMKTQNEEIMKRAEAEMPGILKKMTDGISKVYDVNVSLSAPKMLPMPRTTKASAAWRIPLLSHSAWMMAAANSKLLNQ